jgi:hypothetical protein
MTTNTIDEYLKLGKTTALECLEYYCSGIIECFRTSYYVIILLLILSVC